MVRLGPHTAFRVGRQCFTPAPQRMACTPVLQLREESLRKTKATQLFLFKQELPGPFVLVSSGATHAAAGAPRFLSQGSHLMAPRRSPLQGALEFQWTPRNRRGGGPTERGAQGLVAQSAFVAPGPRSSARNPRGRQLLSGSHPALSPACVCSVCTSGEESPTGQIQCFLQGVSSGPGVSSLPEPHCHAQRTRFLPQSHCLARVHFPCCTAVVSCDVP